MGSGGSYSLYVRRPLRMALGPVTEQALAKRAKKVMKTAAAGTRLYLLKTRHAGKHPFASILFDPRIVTSASDAYQTLTG